MSNYCERCRGFYCLGKCQPFTCDSDKEGTMEVYATSASEAAEKYVERVDESEHDYVGEDITVDVTDKDGEKSSFNVCVEATVTYTAYEK